jgi:ribonuclease P protein component
VAEKNCLFLTKRASNSSPAGNSKPSSPKVSNGLRFTFKKAERLSGKRIIDTLFSEGKSFTVSPIRVFYMEHDFKDNYPAKVLIGAARSHLPKAVDRNKAKRLIREAFRRNKNILYSVLEKKNKKLIAGFIYQSDKIVPFDQVEAKIIVTLRRLVTLYDIR